MTPPKVEGIHWGSGYFDWSWQHTGFGQLSFNVNRETGEIVIDNECMNREAVREILHAFADHIADNGILRDG
jgi:hypothetical protein